MVSAPGLWRQSNPWLTMAARCLTRLLAVVEMAGVSRVMGSVSGMSPAAAPAAARCSLAASVHPARTAARTSTGTRAAGARWLWPRARGISRAGSVPVAC